MSEIKVKKQSDIVKLREGGKILKEALLRAMEKAKEGASTLDVSLEAERVILSYEAEPAFKGYSSGDSDPFPETACVSLNDEIVHGIPLRNRIIKNGDLVKIDVGVKYKNLITDSARTLIVGEKGSDIAQKLLEITKKSLDVGIKEIKAGKYLGDYSQAVEKFVLENGFKVVHGLVGHGVGYEVHEAPQIPNFGKAGTGIQWREGMVIALEPMVNQFSSGIRIGDDQTTFLTRGGGLSAHFEDTLVVTKNGAENLTR